MYSAIPQAAVATLYNNSPRWLGEDNKARGDEIIGQLPNDEYQLTIADTAHYDFYGVGQALRIFIKSTDPLDMGSAQKSYG